MSIIRRQIRVPVFAVVAALVAALGAGASGAQSPYTTMTGEIGPGTFYEIDVPTIPWNGELVVFVQGIGQPDDPIALPAPGPLRDALTAQGFAMIFTSRSVNGYGAVKDGMQRTHQLRGVFTSRMGAPARVYLVGRSLGGLISVMLAELFPDQYDGVLSGCGLLGGGAVELTYLADARVLFDYFFPGVITGGVFDVREEFVPGDPTYEAVRAALIAGLVSPGQPTLQFARTAKLPGANPTELVTAGLMVIGFTFVQGHDLLDLTNGHMPYDNSQTTYSGSLNDDALNAGVAKYIGDPPATNYVEHYYTPGGDLHIPVLALHKTRDPIVPAFHEDLYADAVDKAGASQFLLQRLVDGFGHCGFLNAELAAFPALVQWVHTGVKPLG